jgi:hypothetical protein
MKVRSEMGNRLTRYERNMVKSGIEAALPLEHYIHPDRITNYPNGIHITDRQKSYYLNQLADKGRIGRKYHSRGWYVWYSYIRIYKNGNDPVEAVGLTPGDIPF